MDGAVPKMWSQTLPGTHLRPHILGILPLYGFIPHVRQLIGITVNISQMDYNLTLLIGDMDELIRCDGGPEAPTGSVSTILFGKSICWRFRMSFR
jgi:hypothetical protein